MQLPARAPVMKGVCTEVGVLKQVRKNRIKGPTVDVNVIYHAQSWHGHSSKV